MAGEMSQGTTVESSGIEPIVKTGSTSDLTSFDELEAVVSQPKSSRKTIDITESKPKTKDASEGKSEAKEKAPKKTKEKDDSNEEESNESDDDETQDSSKSKSKEKPKSSSEEDKQKLQREVKPKVLKARIGDETVDLRSDAVFEVTVNGKKETVTAQELLNEYSGKSQWNKKYSELDTERKQFETNKQELESGIQTWANLSKSDPIAALEYACEISGTDSRKFIQDIRSQFKQAFEEYAQLTPEERKERELSDERDYYKTKAEKIEADRSKARESAELDKRVKTTIAQYNLDNARYVARYEELRTLKAQGVFDGELTPELVGEYHQEMEQRQLVGDIVREIAPDLEDKSSVAKELKSLWDKDPSLTPQDIKHIASEVYGSDAAKRLAKKVKKSNSQAQTVSRPKISMNEPMFFDELD